MQNLIDNFYNFIRSTSVAICQIDYILVHVTTLMHPILSEIPTSPYTSVCLSVCLSESPNYHTTDNYHIMRY